MWEVLPQEVGGLPPWEGEHQPKVVVNVVVVKVVEEGRQEEAMVAEVKQRERVKLAEAAEGKEAVRKELTEEAERLLQLGAVRKWW